MKNVAYAMYCCVTSDVENDATSSDVVVCGLCDVEHVL